MIYNKYKKNKLFFLLLLFLCSLIFLGIYFCFINNYGWDWDTYVMIDTYLNILEEGNYIRSRGAGYIVPEIGIGFLSLYFGSFAANITSLFFLIFGLIFLYKSFFKIMQKNLHFNSTKYNELLIIFLLVCLSNHVVFRDSTIPMDYSWSFLFYSLGFYFITNKKIELSIIFFSLCFGSRFNFIVFILPTILFLSQSFVDNKKKILISFIIITYGGLFYLPSWLQAKFSLDFIFSPQWYNAFKPAGALSIEDFARFLHKTISTLGLFFLLTVSFILIINKKKILIIFKNYKIQTTLILINLIVFFFFPWEPSFLWILIFALNFILVTFFKRKILYILILINLFTWFYEAKIIKVEYVNNGCSKDPIEAKFKLNFEKGIMLTVSERQYQTNCYPDLLGKNNKIIKYKKQFAKGSRLLN
jgi:hypothetical protein